MVTGVPTPRQTPSDVGITGCGHDQRSAFHPTHYYRFLPLWFTLHWAHSGCTLDGLVVCDTLTYAALERPIPARVPPDVWFVGHYHSDGYFTTLVIILVWTFIG